MKFYLGLLVFALCIAASGSALSQVYIGAALGVSEPYDMEAEGALPALEGDTVMRGFVGNRLSPVFAVELGYSSFGEYEVEDIDAIGFSENTLAITGLDASVLGKFPFGKRLSFYGRLGAFFWEAERTTLDPNTGIREMVLADDLDYVVGAGVEIRPFRHFGLIFDANNYTTNKVYHLVYGLGLFYNF